MTTATAINCPRGCGTRLHHDSDHWGAYAICLRCGFYEDEKTPDVMNPNTLKYIGLDTRLKNQVADYTEVLNPHSKTKVIAQRIIGCPRHHNGIHCGLEMESTGHTIEGETVNDVNTRRSMRSLQEYRCNRGHRIGIVPDFVGWTEA